MDYHSYDIDAFDKNELSKVSHIEYWRVNGNNNTKLTLYWDAESDIREMTQGDLNKLTIVGWSGSKWESIASNIDPLRYNSHTSDYKLTEFSSDIDAGTITTTDLINPDKYAAFTFGVIGDNGNLAKNRFETYPNPVNAGEVVNVNYTLAKGSAKGTIRIFNSVNQLIYSVNIDSNQDIVQLPLNSNNPGVFTIVVTNDKEQSSYQTVIVVD